MKDSLQFVPSRVEGQPKVTEVAVFSDRLELCSAGKWLSLPFVEMVEWPQPKWFWQLMAWLGWKRRFLAVGERDWFHPPKNRFFRFFSSPPVVVYMPEEPADSSYGNTLFRRVQEIMRRGGFSTWDLG